MTQYGFALQDSDSEAELGSKVKLFKPSRKSSKRHVLFIFLVLVLLAVALGVGLGLGLKKKEKSSEESFTPAAQGGHVKTTTSTRAPINSDWIDQPCMPPGGNKLTCPWRQNPLILFSVDGFRAEYMKRNVTPTLQRLARCGVTTPYMRAMYPTLTFPNHYTIVTGMYPASHGIVNNFMYDPKLNKTFTMSGQEKLMSEWWGGEPIWITAKKQGKKSGAYFWVGTDMNISGFYPDIWHVYNGSISYESRVDAVLEWLSRPRSTRPDVILLYVDEPDHTGHAKGPESHEISTKLMRVDNIVKRLMDGLYHRRMDHCVNLMVTADHGMADTSCERTVDLRGYIDVKDYLIFNGAVGTIHKDYFEKKIGKKYVVHKKTKDILRGEVIRELECKSAHFNIYTKETAPVRHHYVNSQRLGDITVDVQAEWLLVKSSKPYCPHGNHGYDNIYKSMQALFVAHGPGFKQGVETTPFENIELYNVMCDLLGITPAPNNGTLGSLDHILHSPSLKATTVTSHNYRICKRNANNPDTSGTQCYCNTVIQTPSHMGTDSPFGEPQLVEDSNTCILHNSQYKTGYSVMYKMPVWSSFTLTDKQKFINISGEFCSIFDKRILQNDSRSCNIYKNENKTISFVFLFHPNFQNGNTNEAQLSSNYVPMYDGFRTGIWTYVWRMISDYNSQPGDMSVTLGPAFDYNYDGLYDQNTYVNSTESIPTHFYIILMRCNTTDKLDECQEKDVNTMSFIFPHVAKIPNCMPENTYMKENVARIRDIELLTGLRFLTNMEVNKAIRLKTFLPTSLWQTTDIAYSWKDLSCNAATTDHCPGKVPLLLISLDGFRAEYLQRKLTPVIQKLRDCGVHAPYMRSVYPTVTFPNHYTIVTGLYPESHGILSNRMYDEDVGEVFTLGSKTASDPRWWNGEPLWITAKKQGKKTATFFWPGSDVNISGVYPDIWKKYDKKVGFPERVAEVVDWLTLPEDKQPDFITLYFDQPDHAGHQKGPNSDEVNGQLQTVDDMLLRLMDSLYHKNLHNCINIIVIADHGFDTVSCSQVVKLPSYITNITDLLIFDGTFGRIQPQYHRLSQTGSKRYQIFNNTNVRPFMDIVDELMCKHNEMKVFTADTMPRRFHYFNNRRMGDIVLDMEDKWLVSRRNSFYCFGGNHGWDNLYKTMHALFLAHGPGFKKTQHIDSFENIELYNMMCELLGIVPANNNGTWGSLHHILGKPKPIHNLNFNLNYSVCNRSKQVTSSDSCLSSMNLTSAQIIPSSVFDPDTHPTLPFGIPIGNRNLTCILHYSNMVTEYENGKNIPIWTSLKLSNDSKGSETNVKPCMVHDLRIQDLNVTYYTDQKRNITPGYLYSHDLTNNILITTSMVPMYRNFKEGIWTFLWALIKEYVHAYGSSIVVAGPVYDYNGDALVDTEFNHSRLRVNSKSPVLLPSHYFVILTKCRQRSDILPCTEGVDVQSFIIPHTSTTPNCLDEMEFLQDNVARVKDVELITGLQFFSKTSVQAEHARLVTYLPVNLWPAASVNDWIDTSCSANGGKCFSDYRPVLLISLDGFRADYLIRNFTPYIERLSKCGVHAPYMRSVYPTKTFPNHYSIVTGLYPESHGIIDNNMYDRNIGERFGLGKPNASDPRWWTGEPIWNTVKRHGKISATYFWPGSDVEVNGMYPNYWVKYDGSDPYSHRVDRILSWMDLPKGSRPDFLTLYFDEPDKEGHTSGPDNVGKIGEALEKVDQAIKQLMVGLYARDLHNCVNIIIIADHGMSDTACDRLVTYQDYLTSTSNMYIYEGAFSRINPFFRYAKSGLSPVHNPVSVSSIMANLTCHPHFKAYRKEEIPMRHHYANNERIDPIIVDVEDTWQVTFRSLDGYNERYCKGGNHGYDNKYKSMRALFLAYGPAFKQNVTVDAFENIEIYNLITEILNISGHENNGTQHSLSHLLRHPPATDPTPSGSQYSHSLMVTVQEYMAAINTTSCATNCPSLVPHKVFDISQTMQLTSMMTTPHTVQTLPFGYPKLMRRVHATTLFHTMFTLGFRTDINLPIWVSYTLTNNTRVNTNGITEGKCILPDLRVQNHGSAFTTCTVQSANESITWSSLLDRAPEEIKTYWMGSVSSLLVPMFTEFEQGIWKYVHEKLVQWAHKYHIVNVISGPIFDYNSDGIADDFNSYNETVPSHFFVIATRCKYNITLSKCENIKPLTFILHHRKKVTNCQSYDDYLSDNEARVRDVELATGLEFFPAINIDIAVQLRTYLPDGLWTS